MVSDNEPLTMARRKRGESCCAPTEGGSAQLDCLSEQEIATITFLLVAIAVCIFAVGELAMNLVFTGGALRGVGDISVFALSYPLIIPLCALALAGETSGLVAGVLMLVKPGLVLPLLQTGYLELLFCALIAGLLWGSTSSSESAVIPYFLQLFITLCANFLHLHGRCGVTRTRIDLGRSYPMFVRYVARCRDVGRFVDLAILSLALCVHAIVALHRSALTLPWESGAIGSHELEPT